MKANKKYPKILGTIMILMSMTVTLSCTSDPGTVEAFNSTSRGCRNIIGIEMANITDEHRLPVKGVYVTAVIPQHPASMGGLKVGDIITAINKVPVTDVSEALERINNLEPGGKYPFRVYRMTTKPGLKPFTAHILIEKVQERVIGKIS